MSRFRAVIFDLDGVVIDSVPVMKVAFAIAYREIVGAGKPPFDEYRKHFGLSFPVIMDRLGLPREMQAPFIRESNARIGEIAVYSGIPATLTALHAAGIRMGVATGKDGTRARHILSVLSLDRYFTRVLGSDDVQKPKPAPDMILEQVEALDAPLGEILFVGDAVADLECGRNAGIMTAAALWGEGDEAVLLPEKPDFVLSSPEDLLTAVGIVGDVRRIAS